MPQLQSDSFLQVDQQSAVNAVIAAATDRKHLHIVQGPTGIGKTRIAIALVDHYLQLDYQVLVVAKKWRLLEQFTGEVKSHFPKYARSMRRIGGRCEELGHLPIDQRGKLFFTTLSTWNARNNRQQLPNSVQRHSNLLVIWDECHWAINSQIGNALTRHYIRHGTRVERGNALVVGLSATPKRHKSDVAKLTWSTPYVSGLGTRLAYPIHKNVQTGVVWDPIVKNHVVTPASLDQLVSNRDRNQIIVTELAEGRRIGKYTRGIVFACNISHALSLHKLVSEAGIPSVVLHSLLKKAERDRAVSRFRTGQVDVLINVNQFVEGDNVPEIDAVFIARPATSEVLLRQMIGRGSRLTDTKKIFTVVEFTDNIRTHSDAFYHACKLIDDQLVGQTTGHYEYRSPARHVEPDVPSFQNIFFPETGTLPFAREQTFGVEIELTSCDGIGLARTVWQQTAMEILDCVRSKACAPVHTSPLGYHQNKDPTRWVVENDRSAGWEVVSPILVNAEGFHELRRVCLGLAELLQTHPKLRVNFRTGLHITLATRLNTDERVRGFVKCLQRLEPGLMTLVSPSRLFRFDGKAYWINGRNLYCQPVRETLSNVNELLLANFVRQPSNRYQTVNLTHAYEETQKLEIRMHNGTVEFGKIAPWISLWMQIFNRSRYAWEGDGKSGLVFPGGNCGISLQDAEAEDIFQLLAKEEIHLSASFEHVLRERRRQLARVWEKVLPKRVQAWRDAGWYETPTLPASLQFPTIALNGVT